MKKLLLAPILVLSLSGCVHQSVNMSDIQSAIVICASNGATVDSIDALFNGSEMVECSNRVRYYISSDSVSKAITEMNKQ